MPLRPARFDVFLAPLRRRPVGRHGVVLDDGFLFLVQRRSGYPDDARVDNLTATRAVPMLCQLPVDGIEHALAGAGCDQPFLDRPDRRALGNLAGIGEAREAQKSHPVRPPRRAVHFGGKRDEIGRPVQHLQHIAELVPFGIALLGGEQACSHMSTSSAMFWKRHHATAEVFRDPQ